MPKKKLNGDQPATHHDLSLYAGETSRRFDGVEKRLDRIEKNMATKKDLERFATKKDLESVKDTVQRVLQIVESLDGNLSDIPARVTRLERSVFRHH